ncbi:M15 family metallopeptidase [Pendulispora albinea]|uniref:M15 family metallopeptidase n=1 Tax=Pendulispora albinea TaxID=2741071 RepID=A0ABZ2MB86_9BACT
MQIPERRPDAISGSEFLRRTEGLADADRERRIVDEITSGNIPEFLRYLIDVHLSMIAPAQHEATIRVMPDYLAVGDNTDFVLIPMKVASAQRVADAFDAALPTEKIVRAIWNQAPARLWLAGQYGKADCVEARMRSNACYRQYNDVVATERRSIGGALGVLTAGHKKDVILSPRVHQRLSSGKLPTIIFGGWARDGSGPIQGSDPAHDEDWVDYSHGIRLVSLDVTLDGAPARLDELLSNPLYAGLLAAVTIAEPWYPGGRPPVPPLGIDPSAKWAASVVPPIDANPMHLTHTFRDKLNNVLGKLAASGTPFQLVEGFRTTERQQWLYGSGRPTAKPFGRPGPIVTERDGVGARSRHQGNGTPGSGTAADCYPTKNGAVYIPNSTDPVWRAYAAAARAEGLVAGLDWVNFPDAPHCELDI